MANFIVLGDDHITQLEFTCAGYLSQEGFLSIQITSPQSLVIFSFLNHLTGAFSILRSLIIPLFSIQQKYMFLTPSLWLLLHPRRKDEPKIMNAPLLTDIQIIIY